MPTLVQVVTSTPTDIVADLSLVVGNTYQAQFNGPGVLYTRAVVSTDPDPDADGPAWEVTSRQTFSIVPATDEKVFVWVRTAGGTVVVDEVS